MAISPLDLPQKRQEYVLAKSGALIEKIDGELISHDSKLPFTFPFHPQTTDSLMNHVRDAYNAAGWNATIEWNTDTKNKGEMPKKLQLGLSQGIIDTINCERADVSSSAPKNDFYAH